MNRIKINDFQLRSIERYIKISKNDLEKTVCDQYKIKELDQLNATDYNDIIDLIHAYIAKERKWTEKT